MLRDSKQRVAMEKDVWGLTWSERAYGRESQVNLQGTEASNAAEGKGVLKKWQS